MKPFAKNIALAGAALLTAPLAATALRRLRRNSRDFEGRVVAITGASRGLGLALAREFGKRGAALSICARDSHELERAADELAVDGCDTFALDADVRVRSDVERFVNATVARFGAIDVYLHNAGTIAVGPMDVMTLEDYEEALDVHFWAAVYGVEAVLPSMRRRGSGQIATIASIGGLVSVPHLLPYCASKFALVGYSLGLAQELARDGISVTTVCPGLMRTGSHAFAHFKGQAEKESAWFSLMATSPLTAIPPEWAARRVADAIRNREKLVVLSKQAQLLALAEGLFPAFVTRANALVNRLLPAPSA